MTEKEKVREAAALMRCPEQFEYLVWRLEKNAGWFSDRHVLDAALSEIAAGKMQFMGEV